MKQWLWFLWQKNTKSTISKAISYFRDIHTCRPAWNLLRFKRIFLIFKVKWLFSLPTNLTTFIVQFQMKACKLLTYVDQDLQAHKIFAFIRTVGQEKDEPWTCNSTWFSVFRGVNIKLKRRPSIKCYTALSEICSYEDQ